MNPASPLFAILSVATSVVTIGGSAVVLVKVWPEIRNLRAQAKKADVDAAVAEDAADDAHWKAIITAQTEALLDPLRGEVARQGAEIVELRKEVREIRRIYGTALAYIRVLLSWIRARHDDPADLPAPPADIAADI